jgi:hypothetical protein
MSEDPNATMPGLLTSVFDHSLPRRPRACSVVATSRGPNASGCLTSATSAPSRSSSCLCGGALYVCVCVCVCVCVRVLLRRISIEGGGMMGARPPALKRRTYDARHPHAPKAGVAEDGLHSARLACRTRQPMQRQRRPPPPPRPGPRPRRRQRRLQRLLLCGGRRLGGLGGDDAATRLSPPRCGAGKGPGRNDGWRWGGRCRRPAWGGWVRGERAPEGGRCRGGCRRW